MIKLPCKDPHYFHYESPEDQCGGILPWLKDNNSCPVCREEFPEEDSENAIPVPAENFDNPPVNNDEDNDDNEEVDDRVNQQMEEIIQRLFTIPPINTPIPGKFMYSGLFLSKIMSNLSGTTSYNRYKP